MRLLACLIVAPQRGYDEPAILSYAISSFCPTSADGLQTPVAILALSNMVPQLQSGHITALVVTGKTRSPLFPDIPTLAEVRGGENYPATWFGLFAPAGTPKPIIARLAHEVARIVDDR